MRLTTVGTGTAAPSPARVCAGHLIEAGAVRLLMDCGSGVAHRLAQLGIDWMRITHVALTHFHPDHVSDLVTLLVAWRWGALPPRATPIVVVGPPGTRAFIDSLANAFGPSVREPGYPLDLREVDAGRAVDLGDGVRLEAHKVPHTVESVAYSVAQGGQRVVYTGDTGFDAALGTWARGTDVLLAECSLPTALAIPTHLTPEQCGALAGLAAPRQLVLTHFYPPVEETDIRGAVAEQFAGPVVLASDGWSTEIGSA
jgi:ribonuclease BN (tRNA processing enzyme)